MRLPIFKKKNLLTVRLDGEELCSVAEPCEKLPSAFSNGGSTVEFIDGAGISHKHALGNRTGWYHFSIRVHGNLACQADCAITDKQKYDPNDLMQENWEGIRFQPFLYQVQKSRTPISPVKAYLHGAYIFPAMSLAGISCCLANAIDVTNLSRSNPFMPVSAIADIFIRRLANTRSPSATWCPAARYLCRSPIQNSLLL